MKISVDTPHNVKSLWSAAKTDESQNERIKSRILKLDNILQQMLLWSSVSTLLACIQMTFTVARIYSTFTGKHPVLLASTLVIIILLFAIFFYFKWKSIACKSDGFKKASETLLNYRITKLNGERKLVSVFLLAYVLILTLLGVSFWQGFRDGLTPLFKATAPVSLITYGLGFYFMMNFTRQRCKLEILEKQVFRL
jgi:hypothetical protein